MVTKIFEKRMLQTLRCCVAIVSVVGQHLEDDVLGVGTYVRYQFCDADILFGLKI